MDFYILLGVEREASDSEIRRAYRRLARRFHPDVNPGDREAATHYGQILVAYETLIDPERRRRYDTGATSPVADDATTFGFAGFDFSAASTGDRAPTFGDLFEEVFTRRDRHVGAEPRRGRARQSESLVRRGLARFVLGHDHHPSRDVSRLRGLRGAARG